MIVINKRMFPKIKKGVDDALQYLVSNYNFYSCEELLGTQIKSFKTEEIETVCKNEICVFIYWNIYEGLNFYVGRRDWNVGDCMYLSSFYSKFIPILKSDNLKKRNEKRREWFSKYKNYELMKKYEKEDIGKYCEYYVLTELKAIEDNCPEIFEKGVLPQV